MILEVLDTILELSYRLLEDQLLILEQTFLLLETPCYISTSCKFIRKCHLTKTAKNGYSISIIERRFKIRKSG